MTTSKPSNIHDISTGNVVKTFNDIGIKELPAKTLPNGEIIGNFRLYKEGDKHLTEQDLEVLGL